MNTCKRCKQCLDCAIWEGGVLHCSKCGQMVAVRYQIGEDVHIYTFQKFRSKRKEIEGRDDTFKITGEGDLLGRVGFEEFDKLLYNFRSDENAIFPVQEDEGGICKDYKSEDSEGFRQINDLENENT